MSVKVLGFGFGPGLTMAVSVWQEVCLSATRLRRSTGDASESKFHHGYFFSPEWKCWYNTRHETGWFCCVKGHDVTGGQVDVERQNEFIF